MRDEYGREDRSREERGMERGRRNRRGNEKWKKTGMKEGENKRGKALISSYEGKNPICESPTLLPITSQSLYLLIPSCQLLRMWQMALTFKL